MHICSEAPTCVIMKGEMESEATPLWSVIDGQIDRELFSIVSQTYFTAGSLIRSVQCLSNAPAPFFDSSEFRLRVFLRVFPLSFIPSGDPTRIASLLLFLKVTLVFFCPSLTHLLQPDPESWNRRLYQTWSIRFYAASVLVHKSCVMRGDNVFGRYRLVSSEELCCIFLCLSYSLFSYPTQKLCQGLNLTPLTHSLSLSFSHFTLLCVTDLQHLHICVELLC